MPNLKMTEAPIVFYIFDDLNRLIDIIMLKQNVSSAPLRHWNCGVDEEGRLKKSRRFTAVFEVDGYFLSEFVGLLNASSVYYRMVIRNFLNSVKYSNSDSEVRIKFQLVKPKLEIIDHLWNHKICTLLAEKQDLELAMSWLSTLGGAFSALGDCFENCAKTAGKISVQQFKIAFRLDDPPLLARCKLYMALSLIQLGKTGVAKYLIQEQYQLAKDLNDFRLQNMCQGIWAKLQYIYKQKKMQKKKELQSLIFIK